jgi:hypothetical protein
MLATETYVKKKGIVPFCEEHVDAIRPGWRRGARADIDVMARFLRLHRELGQGFTAMIDGEPIAAGGLLPTREGIAEAWGLPGPRVRDYPLFVHRTAVKELHRMIGDLRLRRIEASVLFGNETAVRWIERLGFSEEGFMPLYGPGGETHIRYARLIRPPASRSLMAEVSDG